MPMADGILTVLTPAVSRDLTTLDIARDELGLTDAATDGRIARWIRSASAEIANYLGRELAYEQVTESLYRLSQNGTLLLRRYPVTSIESVMIGDTVIASSDYTLDAARGRLMLYGGAANAWERWDLDIIARNPVSWIPMLRYQPVVVQYWGGYVLPDSVPEPVQDACLLVLRQKLGYAARDPSIQSQSIAGVVSTVYNLSGADAGQAIPAAAQALLDPYREWGG